MENINIESEDYNQAFKVHHIGIVVENISNATKYYSETFGYIPISNVVVDSKQKSRVIFLRLGATVLELIEPINEDSPVAQFANKGGGLHHICYLVDDLDATIKDFRESEALIVCPPTPATAFDGKRIAFVYTKQKELVELCEN